MRKIFDSPVRTATLITFITAISIIFVSLFWEEISSFVLPNTKLGLYEKPFWENFLVELHGIVVELAVVGVLIFWLDARRNRVGERNRLLQDLEDYATLDSPELNIKKLGQLSRLNKSGTSQFHILNLTLNKMNLKGLSIKNSIFIGLKVSSGSISGTTFTNVQMRSSNFEECKIKNSSFQSCHLLKSRFKNSNCQGVSFKDCSLERADFSKANLQNADFSETDVHGAVFDAANLKQSNFTNAKNIDAHQLAMASCLDYIKVSKHLLEKLKLLRPEMNYQGKMAGREGIEPSGDI